MKEQKMDPIEKSLELIDQNFAATLEELKAYLRVPGISQTGEGIRESAELTLSILRDLPDTQVRLVETTGNPVILGTTYCANPAAKTLLFYCFYDLVPVVPKDWATPPFEPTIVNPEVIGLKGDHGDVLVGRGAADHRGPFIAALQAVRAMQQSGGMPVNILWVIEGEEEIGSPALGEFARLHREELSKGDVFWVPRMSRTSDRGPMLVHHGWKGQMWLYLTIEGGEWGGAIDGRDLWAANLNWVDAPIWRLTRAINTLVDEDDRISIDGFWDHVRLAGPQEQAELAALQKTFDADANARAIKVNRYKGGKPGTELLRRYIMDPQINLGQGILPGTPDDLQYTKDLIDETQKTELTMRAYARLDIRLVPDLEQDIVIDLLRKHLDRRGYTEIKIVKARPGYTWSMTDSSIGIYRALHRACAARGVPAEIWPIIPSTAPLNFFNRDPVQMPIIGCGAGHGAWWHEANEYITVEGIREFGKFFVVWMHEWAKETTPDK
jgi:acetylornithine deacetylase/succinyl-diaminopimelate desuccinylase-like protein